MVWWVWWISGSFDDHFHVDHVEHCRIVMLRVAVQVLATQLQDNLGPFAAICESSWLL